MERKVSRRLRLAARLIVAGLAAAWLGLGASTAWYERSWQTWVLHLLLPGGVLLLSLLLAMAWERQGAYLLLFEGSFLSLWVLAAAGAGIVTSWSIAVLLLLLGVPLVLAGALLLLSRWRASA